MTERVDSFLRLTRTSGGFAPILDCCQSRCGAFLGPSPNPPEVVLRTTGRPLAFAISVLRFARGSSPDPSPPSAKPWRRRKRHRRRSISRRRLSSELESQRTSSRSRARGGVRRLASPSSEILRGVPRSWDVGNAPGGAVRRVRGRGPAKLLLELVQTNLVTVTVLGVKSRFVCKSGGSSSPSARLLGRPPVSGGVRGRGNAGRPRRVWS